MNDPREPSDTRAARRLTQALLAVSVALGTVMRQAEEDVGEAVLTAVEDSLRRLLIPRYGMARVERAAEVVEAAYDLICSEFDVTAEDPEEDEWEPGA